MPALDEDEFQYLIGTSKTGYSRKRTPKIHSFNTL